MDSNSFNEQLLWCKKCSLHKNSMCVVPGEGDEDADIMFIGNSPSINEDIEGMPFVGPSGKLLRDAIKASDIDRHYLTNLVKCYNPEVTPSEPHYKKCSHYVNREIEHIDPKAIVGIESIPGKKIFNKTVTNNTIMEIPKLESSFIQINDVTKENFNTTVQTLNRLVKHINEQ